MPIKSLYAGTPQAVTVKVKDVGNVRMGFSPQTSIVHADGKRGALLPILKSPEASTLDIVSGVLKAVAGFALSPAPLVEDRCRFSINRCLCALR